MKPKIYKFDTITRHLKNDKPGEIFKVRDYFQWYHTGIENVINENKGYYFVTNRYENERSEVITYNLFEDENLSDVLLALNNDVYLWDAPYDNDTRDIIADNKFKYIEKLNKQPFIDYTKEKYYERIYAQLDAFNDRQKLIVLPKFKDLNRVLRSIKEYLNNRKVY